MTAKSSAALGVILMATSLSDEQFGQCMISPKWTKCLPGPVYIGTKGKNLEWTPVHPISWATAKALKAMWAATQHQ